MNELLERLFEIQGDMQRIAANAKDISLLNFQDTIKSAQRSAELALNFSEQSLELLSEMAAKIEALEYDR